MPETVTDFHDDQRACGYGHLSSGNTPVAYVTKATTSPTILDVTTTASGFTTINGNDASLASLDGDYKEFKFTANTSPTLEMHFTGGSSISSAWFMPTIRSDGFCVVTMSGEVWNWSLNGGSGGYESFLSSTTLSSDFSSVARLIASGNTNYYYHNSAVDAKVRLTFNSTTLYVGTPTVQIERAGGIKY